MICRREVLEKIGGYDDNLAYGEDFDLPKRIRAAGYDIKSIPAEEYHKLVSSLSEVYQQGRWYGKSMPELVSKHPSTLPSLLSVFFFCVLPLTTTVAYFSFLFRALAALQYAAIGAYLLLGLYRTHNPYMILVPIIKVVRSYGELLGLLEGVFTTDKGRE